MLTGLRIHNYKAFEDDGIELKPLTILLGPNNSGKSSLLSAIRLLSQTIKSPDSSVPLLFNGVMGDFGTFKDVVYGNHRGRPFSIHFKVPFYLPEKVSNRGEVQSRLTEVLFKVEYKFRTVRREVILRSVECMIDGKSSIIARYDDDGGTLRLESIGGRSVAGDLLDQYKDVRLDHFLPAFWSSARIGGDRLKNSSSEVQMQSRTLSDVSMASWTTREHLENIDYLSGMRIPPSRTYQHTGERRNTVGMHGEHVAGILALDWRRYRKKSKTLLHLLTRWMQSAGMVDLIEVSDISDRHFEIRVRHPETGEIQNLADVGYGVSQIVPVLVAGYMADSGSTVIIEEPEIHLHPRAQAALGDFFVDISVRGVQAIVETHSEHMLLRIQQHVASGNLDPSDLGIYYVHSATGRKRITKIELDQNGKYTTKWPHGFFPERLEEATRLSKIRHSQLKLPLR